MMRIKKTSQLMLFILNGLLLLIPLWNMSMWFLNDWLPLEAVFSHSVFVRTPEGMVNIATLNLNPLQRFLGVFSSLIESASLLIGMIILRKLFQNYKKGHIFTLENAKKYQQLGYLFFLHAFITKPLAETFSVIAVTLNNPPGHRYISIGFGPPNLETIFCGILVIIISWVMIEGQKLQDDQHLTI